MSAESRKIRLAILEELNATPRGFLQPEKALLSTVRLSVCPPPSDDTIRRELDRLEEDASVHCEVSDLAGKRWCITSIGRARYADAT